MFHQLDLEIKLSLFKITKLSQLLCAVHWLVCRKMGLFKAAIVHYRPVVPGGAMAPPDFGRSVNPISTKGGRLCPPNNTGTTGFSDLPMALIYLFHRIELWIMNYRQIAFLPSIPLLSRTCVQDFGLYLAFIFCRYQYRDQCFWGF